MTRPLLAPEFVAATEKAQRDFGLCAPCLGRRVGKVETGLTNAQRAEILGVPTKPIAECWLCEGLFETAEIDALAQVAIEAVAPYEHRHFLIGTKLDPLMELREAEINAALALGDKTERSQSEINREVGKRVAAVTGKPVEFKAPDITVIVDARFLDAEMQFGPLFVFGRYRKLSREIPQTTWPCNRCGGRRCLKCGMTGRQYRESVQAFVAAPFLDATRATVQSFHGAGREDIDARCLGEGRPFVLEIGDPRTRTIDLAPFPDLVKRISGGTVEIEGLRSTTKAEVAHVKEHGGSKTYVAQVRFDRAVDVAALHAALDALRGKTIGQRTPQRVEHRRSDLVRERRVLDITLESFAPSGTEATLRVHGDAGLYIKELMSGDEGRTNPSLTGLLGVPAKVTALDVVAVEYEPPASAN